MNPLLDEGAMFPISLRKLFPYASFVGCADIWVQHATHDSRVCRSGSLFAAIPGTCTDGITHIPDALKQGATSLLTLKPQTEVMLPQCIVPNVRQAFSELSAALNGNPSRQLSLLGVTGTNGKTTVSWITRSILQANGHKTGLLGTIENSNGDESAPAALTTPDAKYFQAALKQMVKHDCQYALAEVSSHGLDQFRVDGSRFKAVAITNVTQDHLDYHKNYDDYLAAKARLVQLCDPKGTIVVNLDDEGSCQIAERAKPSQSLMTVSLHSRTADLYAEVIDETFERTRFILHYKEDSVPIECRLIGTHNLTNCLMAAGLAFACELPLEAIITGIQQLSSVPGRLEKISHDNQPQIVIDYAHTDDALKHTLSVLKKLTSGKLYTVLGAGGDRDSSKRPLMGRAVELTDVAVVTSDNPRSEDPQTIIDQICDGINSLENRPQLLTETDRRAAIELVLRQAQPADTVLIAGKGHEKVQVVGDQEIPFDDCEVVRSLLEQTEMTEIGLTVNS